MNARMINNAKSTFRITIIHPCVGKRIGMKKYIRTWKMQPIPAAMVASLLPQDVERRFYDDRLEPIPFDEATDLVMLSVETYTAKRCYQIASEYRRRGIPVVMGGFHATLCPEEVKQYCESIVIGEAEGLLQEAVDDYRHGTPRTIYKADERPPLVVTPDRTIFEGKKYLPIKLVEFARGCRFKCDFCAIQSFFDASHNHRPIDLVISEIERIRKPGQMFFFIDDNITSNLDEAKEFMRALIPLKIRWVSQSAINVAYDDEALRLMQASGCVGILVGFESLDESTLRQMNKGFNLMKGGPAEALDRLRKHNICVYGTFIFGYDNDGPDSFRKTMEFAKSNGLFIGAFNHVTPFPGTPLYKRMESEGRLLFDAWWLDDDYRYNMIPFTPANMTPGDLEDMCLKARKEFYSWPSIMRRARTRVNFRTPYRLANYLVINAMHRFDVSGRSGLPLGDENWQGELIKAE